MPRNSFARAAATVLCTAALAAMQSSPASAAGRVDKKVSMYFTHTKETTAWTQKHGSTSIKLTWCRDSGVPFHAMLMRSVGGPDIKIESHDMNCVAGARVFYSAPADGNYYFRFTKFEDGRWVVANATISYSR